MPLSASQFDIVPDESLDRISQSIRDNAEFHSIADFHGVGIHRVDVHGSPPGGAGICCRGCCTAGTAAGR